ncbi:MAG TPA: chorismate-binding protein [Candidatus Saccharimonadales bacterium]|nr:chorismate-binding protein [Candidatus Saccharimonadales bacterium]
MKLPKIQLSQKPTYIKFAEDIDFLSLFKNIEEAFENCFIFESLTRGENFSRYSLIGFDPLHIISAREKNLVIDGKVYPVENPYNALREIMPTPTIAKNYAGGLIGYLSYEAANYFETALQIKTHEVFDQFMFGVYTDGVILDKLTNELFYFYYDNNRIEVVNEFLKKNETSVETHCNASLQKDTLTKEEHAKIVEKVKEEIKAGNTFQCEVGFKTEFAITGDTFQIYEKLREVNPSPFMYYLKFGKKKIIGASPELLFSLRDGEMTTRPLAGTIQRGKDEKEDQQFARQLLNDQKEIAEHTMLIDLHRNDMGKVSRFGTVKMRDVMTIEKFSHVQHISSEISGIIQSDEDMFSALASNFPAGTVSGAPKIESMKIIDSNEAQARGPYGGGVGQFGFNGDCTFALALRSLFISGNYAYTQTSSGIVYDSHPEKEYEEVQKKLAAMKKVLTI